jgi:O-antigen ligase
MPLLLLIALAALSIPFAMSQKLALYSAFRWLLAFVLYLALVQMDVPSEKVTLIFLGGLAVHAVIGLAQVLHQGAIGLPGELIPGWDQSRVAAIQIGDQWWLRAYGLTFHPNVFGGFMMVGLILGLPMLRRPTFIPLWMLFFLGLLFSFSRSALMATMLILPLFAGWMIWRRENMRRPVLIAVGLLLFLGMIFSLLQFEQIQARLSVFTLSSERGSWLGRGELIATAFRAIESRPLTGLGAGNFPLAVLLTDIQEIPHAVHNIPLLLAAEIGIVGGLVWLWLWLWPGYTLAALNKSADPRLISLIGSWMALGIVGLWDFYPWGLNAGRLLAVTLIAWTSRALAKRCLHLQAIQGVVTSRISCEGANHHHMSTENIHPQHS